MKKNTAKLIIENRSLWPDEFVNPVCEWIVARAQITWRYRILLKGGINWFGRGGKNEQRSQIHRHHHRAFGFFGGHKKGTPYVNNKAIYPTEIKDPRFKWSASHQIQNRLEHFVFLIAHEAYHASGGHPSLFKNPNGTTNADSMEFRCNDFGHQTVIAFREYWKTTLKAKVRAALRKSRDRVEAAKQQKVEAKMAKTDPNVKLTAAQQSLAMWEKKLKLAQTKVKKYQRLVKLYERLKTKPKVEKPAKAVNPLIMYKKPIGPKLPKAGTIIRDQFRYPEAMYLPTDDGQMLRCKIEGGDVLAPDNYHFMDDGTHFIVNDLAYAKHQVLTKCEAGCDCQSESLAEAAMG